MNLTDARIVLTGAAGGIGSATAGWLANAGATLVLADLKQQALDRVADDIGAGHVLAAVTADVTTDGGRSALVATARKHDVNVLINAAGINPFGLLAEQTTAEVARAFAINAAAPLLPLVSTGRPLAAASRQTLAKAS